MDAKQFARRLRKEQTEAERRLWWHLRNRQQEGWKFRRQFRIGGYIVDFVSIDARLIVELDGGQHSEQGPTMSLEQKNWKRPDLSFCVSETAMFLRTVKV